MIDKHSIARRQCIGSQFVYVFSQLMVKRDPNYISHLPSSSTVGKY